jgi:hypothetical protein
MSETTNNFSLLNVEVPDSVDNAAKNLTDLPTKNAGQTLADCWYLVFGGISQMAEKRKIKYALDLEIFKKSLEDKIAKIPEENRIEGKIQTIMPALENSKYCVEEDELREMFSNLISASIDNRKSDLVHPSFGELLKTMSTLDAQNLLLLQDKRYLPVCDVKLIKSEKPTYSYVITNLFLMNPDCTKMQESSQSISSLTRLGLIESLYNQYLEQPNAYDVYEEFLNNYTSIHPNPNLKLEKRVIQLTSLGISFLQICCP